MRQTIVLLPVSMLVLAMAELGWIPYLSWSETIQHIFLGSLALMALFALGHTFVWGKICP